MKLNEWLTDRWWEHARELNEWLIDRSLSLYDALGAIEDSGLSSLQVVAQCLDEYLVAKDMEPDVAVAAYERVLDAVDAAIVQGLGIDLLIQLRDDLTYLPDEIVSRVRGVRGDAA